MSATAWAETCCQYQRRRRNILRQNIEARADDAIEGKDRIEAEISAKNLEIRDVYRVQGNTADRLSIAVRYLSTGCIVETPGLIAVSNGLKNESRMPSPSKKLVVPKAMGGCGIGG